MKHIGHVDGARTDQLWRTHSLGMLSPHELFIPTPGERENISADQFELVGWVTPDTDGGPMWTQRTDTDKDTRPAYVRRTEPAVAAQSAPLTTRTVTGLEPTEDIHRRVDDLVRRLSILVKTDEELAARIGQLEARPPASAMSFYDHAFIACAVQAIAENNGITKSIEIAHTLASALTRNRANRI